MLVTDKVLRLTWVAHTTCYFVAETYEIHGMNSMCRSCTAYGTLAMMVGRQFRSSPQGLAIEW